jgi:hypothetical protein
MKPMRRRGAEQSRESNGCRAEQGVEWLQSIRLPSSQHNTHISNTSNIIHINIVFRITIVPRTRTFTKQNSNFTANMKHAPILAFLTLVSQAFANCDCGYRYFLIFTFICSPAQRPQHQSD